MSQCSTLYCKCNDAANKATIFSNLRSDTVATVNMLIANNTHNLKYYKLCYAFKYFFGSWLKAYLLAGNESSVLKDVAEPLKAFY